MGKENNTLSIQISNFETAGDGKMYVRVYVDNGCVYKKDAKEEGLSVEVTGGCKDQPKVRVKVIESCFGPNKVRGEWEFSGEEVVRGIHGIKTGTEDAKASFDIKFKAGEECKEFSTTSDSD